VGLLGPDRRHEEQNATGAATSEGSAIQTRDLAADSFQTGGFGLTQDKQFQRDFYGASATKYLTSTRSSSAPTMRKSRPTSSSS
jgi:hypothetical protein